MHRIRHRTSSQAIVSAPPTIQSALLVFAAALCILLAPPPPVFQRPLICAETRFIGSYAHIMVNCDAASFVEFAENPSRVLEKRSMRQTRPGYAVLGTVMAIPFRATQPITGNPYYAGYVGLNFLLMIACVLMMRDLLGANSLLAPFAIVSTAVLLFNHITKAFLWTPHTQVMGLFVSMLCIWIARRLIETGTQFTLGRAAAAGILSGLACLTYGAFVLVPLSITVAMWVFAKRENVRQRVAATGALWVTVALPLVAWRAFVITRTGSFYSHETDYYHEFVWIAERWTQGTFASSLIANLWAFIGTIPRAMALPFAFLAATIALAAARKRFDANGLNHSTTKASMVFLAVAIPFYALMGYYDPRLTAALIPGFAVIAGIITRNAFDDRSSRLPEPVTIAAIAYAVLVLMLPGPYA